MSLSARLTRIEAAEGNQTQRYDLVAVDDADADRLFEEALLRCRPGQCSIRIEFPGGVTKWTGDMLSHEERLELLT